MPGCHLTRPQFTKAAERIYFDDDDDDYDVADNDYHLRFVCNVLLTF